MSNSECDPNGSASVESKNGFQGMTATISGFLLFVIAWSFLFTPNIGDPYAEVMAKMFGPGQAFFAGLGLLVIALVPGRLSFRGVDIAFVVAAAITSFMWLSL